MKTVPNFLTFFRILSLPVLVMAFYENSVPWLWGGFFIFVAACLSDFLDGYLARLLSQTTRLGQFMDPVADKLFVITALFLMVSFDKLEGIHLIPAFVILWREIFVSGLREFLGNLNVSVPVTRLAKWKTALQMLAIGAILFGGTDVLGPQIFELGILLLWGVALITLITGYNYLKKGLKHL